MDHLRIGERTIRRSDCGVCGSTFDHVTGFLHLGPDPFAAYFAACHLHPEPEAQIDVVLGTWGADDASDHATFACRVRRTGAMLVDAPVAVDSADPILGACLTRDVARADPRIGWFWDIVDHLSTFDPTVRQHLGQDVDRSDA